LLAGTGIHYRDARAPDDIVLYAIGDVHGRLDLLTRMFERISADRDRRGARDWRIILLGDYTDRGPESAGVISFLIREMAKDERMICLAGNHDTGFLDFLAQPDARGIFANHGGIETAASYGVTLNLFHEHMLAPSRDALVEAMPPAHVEFLEGLKFWVSFGDFFFCHAGVRPGAPLTEQDPLDLTWIRAEFHRHTGLYDKVVVHGHTPVNEAEIRPNRVNVDTGAFRTGKLTALVVDGAEKQLLIVEGKAE
jgi:serine/threonine protein phosphatase 1